MVVRLQLIIAGPAGSPYHAHAVTHSGHSGSCATAPPRLRAGKWWETYSVTLTCIYSPGSLGFGGGGVIFPEVPNREGETKNAPWCHFWEHLRSLLLFTQPKLYLHFLTESHPCIIISPHQKLLSLNFPVDTTTQTIDKWAGRERERGRRARPGMKQVDGPLRSASAGTPRLHPPILFTNAHRCSNIISCGTRCYLAFLAPLRRHLPMFSRHDINSPKEACSLTDSPSWNLTDNDFVFAEAGAPWGVGGEKCVLGLCFKKKKKKIFPALP